eukprot:jgi/Bigna1/80291/fgenesh1_pg.69_\
MPIPPFYGSIGKDVKDPAKLFGAKVLKFSTSNGKGASIQSYTELRDKSVVSYLKTKCTSKKIDSTFSLTVNTKSEVEIAASSKKLYDGLKATLTGKLNTRCSILDFQYKSKIYEDYGFSGQSKFKYEPHKNTIKTQISGCIGDKRGISIGAMIPLAMNTNTMTLAEDTLQLDNLSLGVELKLKDATYHLLT